MRVALSRHRVLVTVPLAQAALERLDVFFDVDIDLEVGAAADASKMMCRLGDMAGVVVDSRMAFDARMVRQLPMLRAISIVESGHDRLDFDALTEAGIRATNTPVIEVLGRGNIAIEGLVSSLGFGRRSFHPPYLLNPDVSCTSCC